MDFSWALPFPEIHKVCTLFQLKEISDPIKYSYSPMQQIFQEGPQCGLVALAMCMKKANKEILGLIYESAKNKNYTYNGEMFSVNEMFNLAKEYLNDCKVDIFNGDLNDDHIKQFLLEGGILLVPYDTDKDNSPGLHKGHKAHWAVICGSILTNDDFFVLARHGKARNIAVWKLDILAESNKQLFEFSPDRKLQNVKYKLPEGGISGFSGLNKKCVLIKYL